MKVSEVIKRLEAAEWYLARVKGSHRQFKHLTNPNVVTVPGKLSEDIPAGTLNNILKKARLK